MASFAQLRVGVVGCGYGAGVLVPAFRVDQGVQIVAIAGGRAQRAAETARNLGIPQSFGSWTSMLEQAGLDAIAVAVPPALQPEIAAAALGKGVSVFAEKPLAASLDEARALVRSAVASHRSHAVDFNFRGISAMRAARDLLQSGTLGFIRHVNVTWNVETYSSRVRVASWKTDRDAGGGALSNFVSHSMDYLEWLVGRVTGLSARLGALRDDPRPNETTASLALQFETGTAGSLVMSTAAYQGSGHRLDFYGDDGTLVLENTTTDYMRGFRLLLARRPDALAEIRVDLSEEDRWEDGRVLPASRLVRQFVNRCRGEPASGPDFKSGLRVQELLHAARLSHQTGRWVDLPHTDTTEGT